MTHLATADTIIWKVA